LISVKHGRFLPYPFSPFLSAISSLPLLRSAKAAPNSPRPPRTKTNKNGLFRFVSFLSPPARQKPVPPHLDQGSRPERWQEQFDFLSDLLDRVMDLMPAAMTLPRFSLLSFPSVSVSVGFVFGLVPIPPARSSLLNVFLPKSSSSKERNPFFPPLSPSFLFPTELAARVNPLSDFVPPSVSPFFFLGQGSCADKQGFWTESSTPVKMTRPFLFSVSFLSGLVHIGNSWACPFHPRVIRPLFLSIPGFDFSPYSSTLISILLCQNYFIPYFEAGEMDPVSPSS